MLVQDRRADDDQHHATQNFSTFAHHATDDAAQHHTDRHHGQGRQADQSGRQPDVDVHKRQTYTHGQCINAGGKSRDGEQPETMLLGLLDLFFGLFVFHPVMDHVQSEQQQQGESDPVVPTGHELRGSLADKPADNRRDGFDQAEDQADTQGFEKFGFVQGRAFTDSGREGIGGHGESKENKRGWVHAVIPVGLESTTYPRARLQRRYVDGLTNQKVPAPRHVAENVDTGACDESQTGYSPKRRAG